MHASSAVLRCVLIQSGGIPPLNAGAQEEKMSSEMSSPMQAIYYILLLRPSPFLGVLDFYVLVPFSKLIQRRYQVADLTLRDRLGSGNFGQVIIWRL